MQWEILMISLSEFKGKVKGVMHCYTGSSEMAKDLWSLVTIFLFQER